MTSINPDINALHATFCAVTDRVMPLLPQMERWWHEAIKCDVTPDMVRDVMESRLKRDYSTHGMRINCLSLRHCIGDEDRLAQFVDEAAQIAATKRKRVYVDGKVQVLSVTGRATEPEPPKVRHVSEIAIDALKQAAR